MALLKLYKFFEIDDINHFLAGGIRGTSDIARPRPGGPPGIIGLVGKKLTFNKPSGTVTFTEGANGNHLLFKEIKSQIETAIPALLVKQTAGALSFIEKTPSTGVVLKGDGSANSSANTLLGFDGENNTIGKVYDSPHSNRPDPPSVPHLVQIYMVNDGMHVVAVME